MSDNEAALFAVKNLGYNLSDAEAKTYYNQVNLEFIKHFSKSEQGIFIIRQACGTQSESARVFQNAESAEWLFNYFSEVFKDGSQQQ